MYLTALQLLDRFDARELAQIAVPASMPRIDPALLRAVVEGEDVSEWPADEVAAAQAAQGRVDDAITDAAQEVDGYLAQRYPLPIEPVPSLLTRVTANIARFNLHDDSATDEIRKRYEDSIRTLKAVANGQMSLGIDDPSPARGAGPTATKTRRDRKFTDDTLADYR